MKSVLFETVYVEKIFNNVEKIEEYLTKRYGSIVRWAIVNVDDNFFKITVSYEKDV
jgi:hypothetical protein